jgi:Tfp pilus assembly protein PilN
MGIFQRRQGTPWRAENISVATLPTDASDRVAWERNLRALRAAKQAEAEVELRRETAALQRQLASVRRASTGASLAEDAEPWADWSSQRRGERFARGQDS